jgi:hypothetical protein
MGAAEVMRLDYTGGVKVVPTTASTSPTTGALTVAGGVGIGGQLHVGTAGSVVARLALYGGAGSGEGANISIQKGGVFNWVFGSASCILGGTSDDFLIFASGVGNEAFRISTADRSVSIKSTTASTSSTTGALVVSGGVGIGGAISINASDSTISYSTGSPGLVLTPKDAAVGYPIVFRNNTASWIGSISLVAGQGSVSYNTTSDVRGKPNREPLLPDTARNIIDALEVYDFDKDGNAIRGIGLVAQQAYAVHKSLATPGHKDEDYWMAEKAAPMPFVIVNLQLLNNEIAELKRQLKERD